MVQWSNQFLHDRSKKSTGPTWIFPGTDGAHLVKELEPYRLFIEEPVLSENREALKEIAAIGSTAAGTSSLCLSS
ncbi:hypothetical protein P9272_12155 [Mesorhizobium sp. WSM4976]|uniref:hypothetical protein n=1 Tax=Mesorhizobium sp. WSM4976 TaxID=3038549 RepID=UPI002417D705|nr:hypothetical protein [Mesorhizobium sp. WSM4976]MDG4894322.1 hypothetical protein [Mesorhizobium sp. WSM4976]